MWTYGQKISIDLKRRAIAEAIKSKIYAPRPPSYAAFTQYVANIPCRLRRDGIFAKKSAYGAAKTGSSNCRNLTDLRQGLKFFISLESPQEPELPAKVFYDDMYRSIIEGAGEQRRKRL